MFDHVAPRYDLMNDVMSLGISRTWRPRTVAAIAPQPGERILDLAAGTGTSSAPLRDAGAEVISCDLSHGMLVEGHHRHPELWFVNGDALRLPFADASFDAVTISYGLRNVEDTVAALREMRRVTKSGGRLVVNEFSTPPNPAFRWLYQTMTGRVLPAMGRMLSSNPTAYSYLVESIADWPVQAGLAEIMEQAGWQGVEWRNLTGGIVALHRGWNR